MSDFQFAEPKYFYLLIAVGALVFASKLAANFALKRLSLFSSHPRWRSYLEFAGPKNLDLSTVITLISMVFIILALARPQGDPIVEEREGNVLDIIVALDVSSSMAAEDTAPNRLEKAKHSIETMLNQLYGDRVGLIAFAGSAVLVSPLTSDYSIIRSFLDALNPETISNQGTNFEAVARTAVAAFKRGSERDPSVEDRSHIIVIFSDGEATTGDFFETAKALKDAGIIIHTVAIGTNKGVPIPIRDQNGVLKSYKLDRMRNTVISKVNFDMLKKIADSGGGLAFKSTLAEREITALVDSFRNLDRASAQSIKAKIYQEYFYWPLAIGLILLSIVYIPWNAFFFKIGILRSIVILGLGLGFGSIAYAQGESEDGIEDESLPPPQTDGLDPNQIEPAQDGQTPPAAPSIEDKKPTALQKLLFEPKRIRSEEALNLYRQKKVKEASKLYKSILAEDPDSKIAAFNTATALAREGKTDEAQALFQQLNDVNKEEELAPEHAETVNDFSRFNSAGTSAMKKDTADAIQKYADLITKIGKNPDANLDKQAILAQAKKNIEHLLTSQEGKQKLKDDEKKQDQQKNQKKDQQKQSGQGNQKDKQDKSKNQDKNEQNQDQKPNDADNQNQDQKQDEKKPEQEKKQEKKLSTKRKKFKKNEVLSERQARQILRSLRQHEGLLQKKFLRQRSRRSSGEDEPEMDW